MGDTATLSLALALGAGLLSFLSACVLPIVPGFLASVAGASISEPLPTGGRRGPSALSHGVAFMLGFGAVFVALGATSTMPGALLARWLWVPRLAGGVMLVALGGYLLAAGRSSLSSAARRTWGPAALALSLLAGMAFCAGWTPCVGPVLASILLMAGTVGSVLRGESLLAAYTLGLALPFIGGALVLQWLIGRRLRSARVLRASRIGSGLVLMIVGAMLASGRFNTLTGFLAGFGQLITIGN